MDLTLYGYWRSSAAYRLRIALNLKAVPYEKVSVNIAPDASVQKSAEFQSINPQSRVPVLKVGETYLTQSMAILEWLEETYPQPALLPTDPILRAECRAFADLIACDIHPINNLSVLQALKHDFAASPEQISDWYAHWIKIGFFALEKCAEKSRGPFLFGEAPGLAEICLIPQIYNAHRYKVDMQVFPHLAAIDTKCLALEAFDRARPEHQDEARSV